MALKHTQAISNRSFINSFRLRGLPQTRVVEPAKAGFVCVDATYSRSIEDMNLPQLSQSGFTLIECLIAMVIVSILMTVIAPIFTLSVSNRVQARRVEMATQAARAYMNGIESGAIEPPKHTVQLNEVDNENNFIAQRVIFAGVAPPVATRGLSCLATTGGNSYCWNTLTSSLYCIDLDSDGCSSNSAKDLVIQAFRSVTPSSTDADKGYLIGVRVYRADAFSDDTPLVKSDPENKRTQMAFSRGFGDRKAPLMEVTTEIVKDQATLQDFCDRLGCQDASEAQ
jgi:prepilin-type N-terminal cleavage/methylation domain-containing protein